MKIIIIICILCLLLVSSVVSAQTDPFDYLQSHYVYSNAVPNPQPSFGKIVGADAFNNGEIYAILWEYGTVGFFDESSIATTEFIATLGDAGITEVPGDIYLGEIAVTDANSIYFYNRSGSYKGLINVISGDILDITYDSERDRIILSTNSGIGSLNVDGTLTSILSGGYSYGVEVIDMESNPSTYDMLQREEHFNKFNLDGTLHSGGSFQTDLGSPNIIEGIAYTESHAIMAVQGGFYVYDKLLFQNHTETQPYLPEITLISPLNNYLENQTDTITFQYQISSFHDMDSCTLVINNQELQTDTSVTAGITEEFTQQLVNDYYEWYVTCNNTNGRKGTSQTRNLTVDVNHPPVLDVIGDKIIDENQILVIELNGTDPDNDALSYGTDAESVLPSSFIFSNLTGYFEWTPTLDDSGEYHVLFSVTDSEFSDNETINITVNDLILNNPPVLEPIGNKEVNETDTLIIQLNASDPDNDTLTYDTNAGNILPSAFSFDNITGLFNWTPTLDDSGSYNVVFNVTDDIESDSEEIMITVLDVTIACYQNSDCGIDGPIGVDCTGNNVTQDYINFTCNNPGTAHSFCSNATTTELVQACDDGLWCNGFETCQNGACVAGVAPDCDDGVGCTDDSCDEENDVCSNAVNDNYCDNGLWCDGTEYCNAILDCQPGIPIDCSGNNLTSIETCDNSPDDNPFTWDYFAGFNSTCNESSDVCTTETVNLNHTCDIAQCGADCETDAYCDDGNTSTSDSCNALCGCENIPIVAVCGNNILEFPEHCDDGNTIDGDGCSAVCESENVVAEFDELQIQDNGNGTYNYNFIKNGVTIIEVENNNGLIDLQDANFSYLENKNAKKTAISITNLNLTGTTKSIILPYRSFMCVIDDNLFFASNSLLKYKCLSDPDRITWFGQNKCGEPGNPVPGRDSSKTLLPEYTCEKFQQDGKTYAKLSGLAHTTAIADGTKPVSVNKGWNLFSPEGETAEQSTISEIPLKKGWSLIGYSGNESFRWMDALIKDGSVIKTVEETDGLIRKKLIYYDELGLYRFVPGNDDYLRANKGYWLYSFKDDLKLLIPNIYISPIGEYNWSNVLVNDGIEMKKVKDAKSEGWLQGQMYYFNEDIQQYEYVSEDGTIYPWQGYWLYSSQNLSLIIA